MKFRTETGSLYEIDHEKKTWTRLQEPNIVGMAPLRTATGPFHEISEIKLDCPVRIIGPSLHPERDFRLIQTSRVVEVIND